LLRQGEQRPASNQWEVRLAPVVVAPLHQRNLAAFSPAAFDARHGFFHGSQIHRQRRGKCHGYCWLVESFCDDLKNRFFQREQANQSKYGINK
jgi:hypothetical protein